jgi:signal transduction histidine kinase
MLQQLDRVTQAATSTLDLPDMLKQIIRVCAEELDATSAYISDANLEDNTTTVLVDYISPSASSSEMVSDEGAIYSLTDTFPTTLRWLTNLTPYLLIHADDPELGEAERQHYHAEGGMSVLIVPIYVQGTRLWGYLEFWESRYRRDFSEDEIALAQEIARRIGASIHNARVYTSLKASEAELRHYAAKLEALNSDLDAYAYTIAHDLKSPLHMIMNYTELVAEIERDHMGAESREFLAKVQHHGARMAEMIDQLLALARIGDAAEVLDEVELKPVIDSVIERFEISLQEHHFHIEVEGALPTVKGNVAWLREVFANLVSNAIKYRDEGKDRHFITISVRPHGQKQVRCFVQDNGIGIPPNFVPKLFEMFARVDKHRSGGLGLGLSIVKRLVHKMGGEVGVESTFGEGTTFWFTLPLPEPES